MGSISAEAKNSRLHQNAVRLAEFGTFAFREADLGAILTQAARVCAESLDVPYSTPRSVTANPLSVAAGFSGG
jgi:hypothetical protein